jgi:hypothetical protein
VYEKMWTQSTCHGPWRPLVHHGPADFGHGSSLVELYWPDDAACRWPPRGVREIEEAATVLEVASLRTGRRQLLAR